MAVTLIGAPIGSGAGVGGADSGPMVLRNAGLRDALASSGHAVHDCGDVARAPVVIAEAPERLKALEEVAGWAAALRAVAAARPADDVPVFLGGDHSLSLGTVPGLAERAARLGRPFFLLWIDAHPDCHTPETTESGHLHGTPVAHAMGASGFAPYFRDAAAPVRADHVLMLGIRSVDAAEAAFLRDNRVAVHDPASLRARGVRSVLRPYLSRIAAVNGLLHVSLDADALDPAFAPGVGTPVADGLTIDETRAIMSCVAASDVLGSLDLVEVNPFLDRDRRTARAMAELASVALRPSSAMRNGQVGRA